MLRFLFIFLFLSLTIIDVAHSKNLDQDDDFEEESTEVDLVSSDNQVAVLESQCQVQLGEYTADDEMVVVCMARLSERKIKQIHDLRRKCQGLHGRHSSESTSSSCQRSLKTLQRKFKMWQDKTITELRSARCEKLKSDWTDDDEHVVGCFRRLWKHQFSHLKDTERRCHNYALRSDKRRLGVCQQQLIQLRKLYNLCTTCVPESNLNPLSFEAKAAFGKFRYWHTAWTAPHVNDVSVVFSVRGANDARVLLSPRQNETSAKDGFLITFGSQGNAEITLNDENDGPNGNAPSTYIAPLNNGQVLSMDEYRTFWVNMKNGELTAGFGSEPYRNIIIMLRHDAMVWNYNYTVQPLSKFNRDIKYVSFTTWDAPLDFANITIASGVAPRQTSDTRTFTSTLLYEQFNQPNVYRVSSRAFEVVFELQALSDAMLGFLSSERFREDDEHAYEIWFSEEFERLMAPAYRRSILRHGTGQGGDIYDIYDESDDDKKSVISSEFRPFWVQLRDQHLSVGRGINVGENVILTSQVELIKSDTLVMGFANYFFAAAWRVLKVKSQYGDVNIDFECEELRTHAWRPDVSFTQPITFKTGTDKPWIPLSSPGRQQCIPGVQCHTSLQYDYVTPGVLPRYQWWHHGAFCAETAIQSAAMGLGIYLSQGVIRNVSTVSAGIQFFGDAKHGYEIVPPNIMGVFDKLGLLVEDFDAKQYHQPAYPHFFTWLKSRIADQRLPIVVYLGPVSSKFKYAHAEAVAGYFSNHSLSNTDVFMSDELLMYSGGDLLRTYRRLDEFVDDRFGPVQQFNCTNSKDEGVNCMSSRRPWGYAFKGIVDPLNRTIDTFITVSDNGKEPPPPFVLETFATVTVVGPLQPNTAYTIYRFDGVNAYPKNSYFRDSERITTHHSFVAEEDTYTWHDPTPFPSNSAVYYITTRVPVAADE